MKLLFDVGAVNIPEDVVLQFLTAVTGDNKLFHDITTAISKLQIPCTRQISDCDCTANAIQLNFSGVKLDVDNDFLLILLKKLPNSIVQEILALIVKGQQSG